MAESTIPEENSSLVPAPEERLATREPTRYQVPPVDIYEDEDGLALVFDMPGLEREDLDIRVEDDVLTIKGTVTKEDGPLPDHQEFRLRDYFRQFRLTDAVDQERIGAELSNGVLTVGLPRSERLKPRRIEVAVKA